MQFLLNNAYSAFKFIKLLNNIAQAKINIVPPIGVTKPITEKLILVIV